MSGWDHYFFWTGGPLRNAIYQVAKRVIAFIESFGEG